MLALREEKKARVAAKQPKKTNKQRREGLYHPKLDYVLAEIAFSPYRYVSCMMQSASLQTCVPSDNRGVYVAAVFDRVTHTVKHKLNFFKKCGGCITQAIMLTESHLRQKPYRLR